MVSTLANNIQVVKSSMRLSSVVPATVTSKEHKVRELTNMDLAMKLHYIKGVYFFSSDAAKGLKDDVKVPMFQLLQLYFTAAGRIRRSETSRPFIKCNDAGVRIVEANCDETIDEWLAMAVEDGSGFDALAYNQAVGDPDLEFTPLVFVQFTWFKCGGMSVGISWANVLGDAFSVSNFINLWGKTMAGHLPLESLHEQNAFKGVDSVGNAFSSSTSIHSLRETMATGHTQEKSLYVPDPANPDELPVSVLPNPTPDAMKRVNLVDNLWITPNDCKMKRHTFHVHAEKISHFLSDQKSNVSVFEVLSALIWKSMSKIKENPEETRIVTLCTNKANRRVFESPSNGMVWSSVEADFRVADAEVSELVGLIRNKRKDENDKIEEMMGNNESGENTSVFIAYGAQLTFVNLEEMDIYGLEIKGQKPIYANYSINGVGDEGVVLVLPGPKCGEEDGVTSDRVVTMVLPENQLALLKVELERNWSIV